MKTFSNGETYLIRPGDHFDLVLPDGMVLNVEQTADDFTIVRDNGIVAYRKPTSDVAKQQDGVGWIGDESEQTTGRN